MNNELLETAIISTNQLLHALQEDGYIDISESCVIVSTKGADLYTATFARADLTYRLKIGGSNASDSKYVWLSTTNFEAFIDGIDTKEDLDYFLEKFL